MPLFSLRQTSEILTKADLIKTYTQAVTDFIKAAN
jgi:hypothetical protein